MYRNEKMVTAEQLNKGREMILTDFLQAVEKGIELKNGKVAYENSVHFFDGSFLFPDPIQIDIVRVYRIFIGGVRHSSFGS